MSEPPATEPYLQAADEVVRALGSDSANGLSTTEAASRLQQFGPNELASEEKTPLWKLFVSQFQDVLVILLLIASAISAALWAVEGHSGLPYEALAILAVVLLNAVMGFVQESRAEAAVAALHKMAADKARVIRDGKRTEVPAAELVPGDIVLLEEGDTIPADIRLIHTTALQVAEAALTGESLPVSKDTAPLEDEAGIGDRFNMVYSSTAATYGHARGVVTATGASTEIGRIAGMLQQSDEGPTPLQEELDRVGKLLGGIVVVIAVVMIATIILVEGVRGGLSGLFDVLILGVALAVAAVPEGLPAVVTAVLSIGVQRMARRNAIVRRLAAVETLGSADVVASDKTGTLTKNEMTVRVVVTSSGRANFEGTGYSRQGNVDFDGDAQPEQVLRSELERALAVADRANNSALVQSDGRWAVQGDPTEGALKVAARKAGLSHEDLEERFERVGEVPFSSERKLMSTVHSDAEREERVLVFTKGAPDVLLGRCTCERVGDRDVGLTPERRAEILAANEDLAAQALRTLGVALREVPAGEMDAESVDESIEQHLVFQGLIGMIDPPRDEAREAVARARAAGIRPMMITGDHPVTAAVIAAELGISDGSPAVTGKQLQQMTPDELARVVGQSSVYARVNPEHKLRIVEALQTRGSIVAMTGDGVNDAPALKRADIGIAMGITGTDVSKEAADVILTDDNFATIINAVEEGRGIFSNIRKFMRYLLSSNIGEVLTMFFGVVLAKWIGLDLEGETVVLPLLATQILWINLATDGAPALALGVDPGHPDLMRRQPRERSEGVVTGAMWKGIALNAVVMAAGTLGVLDACLPGGLIDGSGDLRYAQTMAFTTLVMFQMFNVLNSRSDERSAFEGLFANRWLWAALALSLVLQLAVIYVPLLHKAFSTTYLSEGDWLICVGVGSLVLWVRELSKLVGRSPGGPNKQPAGS